MEGSGHTEGDVWGTWEELLLACAVDRHGTESWDSVAMEIQTRTSFSHLLTPQNCRRHYIDLRVRFARTDADEQREETEESGSPAEIPWVEQLRKLRVAELRREVERYDASIRYMQLKLRRLEYERERSSKGTESGEERPDQDKESGEESNSTLPKEDHEKLDGERVKAAQSVVIGGEPADSASPQPVGESAESTVAESKSGDEKEKDAGDVQCSASLSRQRRVVLLSSSSAGEEAEEESVVADKRVADELDPPEIFLETIRSDHHGSILERALASQGADSDRYRSLIRRHVDFEMVRAKLDAVGSGGGSYPTRELRRDLLLLCTNAIVFYPERSPESIAAVHLRYRINREIFASVRPPTPLPPPPSLSDLDLAASRIEKPAPIIVCRRRSSISNARKEEVEEKPKPEPEEEEKNKVVPLLPRKTRRLRTDKSRRRNAGEGSEKPIDVAAKAVAEAVENTPAVQEAAARSKGGASAATSPPEKQKRLASLRSSKGTAPAETPMRRRRKAAEEGKDETTRQSSGGMSGKAGTKKSADARVPGKRSVGRPPKRAASPATTPPPAKRRNGNSEARAAPTRSATVGTRRKRGRR